MMSFKVIAPLFRANTEEGVRTYINQGGTSSGKTYTIVQVLVYIALMDAGSVATVVGQDLPNLKVGALRDAKTIVFQSRWLAEKFKYNESGHFFTCVNGSLIEFKS